MCKVYIAIADYSIDALNELSKVTSNINIRQSGPRPSEDELCDLVKEYDVLIIGAREKMTPRVYSNAHRLKVLGTLSIGLDHIDDKFNKDAKIIMVSCPNANVISVAEHTIGVILALYKKLLLAHQSTISLTGRKGLGGLPYDLNGKTLGLLGAGRIAAKVISMAKAFELKVICYTQNPSKHDDLLNYGVKFSALEDLFSNSDIVSIHLPLTCDTEGLVTDKLINCMKKDSILINTSRTNIVDNFALSSALKGNNIFGAAIDLDIEDAATIDLLKGLSNVILTPHTAGVTTDSILRMDSELSSSLVKLLSSSS